MLVCPSVGQNNLLALLPISHLLLTLLLFIAFFPYIDLWLFVNKFCLEIVVAYCKYMSGLGFQKVIFLFCLNLSINLV